MEQDKNRKNNPFGGMRQAGRAVSDFLRAGRRKEARRERQATTPSTDEDDYTDTAIEERIRRTTGGGRRAQQKAVDDFWRSAMRKGANDGTAAAAPKREESGFDIYDRFSQMPDEEFDRGVADGTITPEQIRKAGQEAYENYMLDVWSETDQAMDMEGKWPSYEEFMENPEKYGYTREIAERNDASEYPDRFYRYKPSRYQKK